MAGEIKTVRLSRVDAQPWGFRLQGGKDFGTPLLIQKVNSGSLADQVGLVAGDAVLKINNTEVFQLRHKEAQDAVVRGGNSFEICVQRGGSTWQPHVIPIGPSPTHYGQNSPVTRTSLAHQRPQDFSAIGTGYNNAARPFNSLNGGPVKSIVNKQYNTPVSMYSDETIAETLSAQAEVLAGGVLGVNFKKNEKMYNSANSEVYKMLQEQANEPEEPAEPSDHHYAPQPHSQYQQPQQQQSHAHQQQSHGHQQQSHGHQQQSHAQHQSHQMHSQANTQSQSHVTKHVTAPIDRPIAPTAGLPAGQNICSECERLIIGVFVRIKDKNLHAECFKCATCGTSLKNQGYYNVNNKLYCDVHAKAAALSKPPPGTQGLLPIAVPTDARLGASAITAAINARVANTNGGSPQLIAPTLYNPQVYNTNVNSNIGGPKPYNYSTQSPMSPPMAGPKSPSSFPPPSNWSQQQTQPQYGAPRAVQNYGSNTLPRQNAGHNQGSNKGGAFGATFAPRRGRGTLNKAVGPGARVPLCGCCNTHIRGPFITALGHIWCPDHFICNTQNCRRPLQDIGFVEEKGMLYCEFCFEKFLAPTCNKCHSKIKGDCLNAIGKHFHPECFTCTYCGKLFGNSAFFLEEGEAYCEADWNEMFTTKCFACGFPVEAGDKWVEALSHNYHSQCFNCTMCKKNLEGQSFIAKSGRPYCKNHH